DYTLTTQEIFNYTSPKVTQYVAQQWGDSQHPVNYDSYSGGLSIFTIATIKSNIASGSLTVDGINCLSQNFCSVLIRPNNPRSITISSIVQPQAIDNIISRYVFVSWNDGNTQPTRTFYTEGEYTATYKTQYLLHVASQINPEGMSIWEDAESTASTGSAEEIITDGDTRWLFHGWSIDGIQVEGNPVDIHMDSSHLVWASYGTQYYLSVSAEQGTVSGSGWYNARSTADTGEAQQIIDDGNTRYVFKNWGVDNVTVTGNPVTIFMDKPHTATADYTTQYYLDVQSKYGNPSGEGWYDSNTVAQVSVTPIVGTLIRHKFVGWSGSSYNENANTNVYMYQPQSVIATWRADYLYLYLLIGVVGVIATVVTLSVTVHIRNNKQKRRLAKVR
ncbi:MAG: hypothetical protein WC333_08805, partial [Dehalococcoidia bacterium]